MLHTTVQCKKPGAYATYSRTGHRNRCIHYIKHITSQIQEHALRQYQSQEQGHMLHKTIQCTKIGAYATYNSSLREIAAYATYYRTRHRSRRIRYIHQYFTQKQQHELHTTVLCTKMLLFLCLVLFYEAYAPMYVCSNFYKWWCCMQRMLPLLLIDVCSICYFYDQYCRSVCPYFYVQD